MNLSRAAKKFRTQIAQEPEAPKPATARKQPKAAPAPIPVPEPVVVTVEPTPEPIPEPVIPAEVPAPTSQPKKAWPVKAKRPRFVREKVERRERTSAPALPPRSTRLVARLLTKNLALLPQDDSKSPR
jgi:hypothetical protein